MQAATWYQLAAEPKRKKRGGERNSGSDGDDGGDSDGGGGGDGGSLDEDEDDERICHLRVKTAYGAGSAKAQVRLGLMYAEGCPQGGVARSVATAVALWKRAAAQGDEQAQACLKLACACAGCGVRTKGDKTCSKCKGIGLQCNNNSVKVCLHAARVPLMRRSGHSVFWCMCWRV